MIERTLYNIAFSEEWGRQMRFITGPRQSGKTTLSKEKLRQEKCEDLFYLWDLRSVRNRYKANELFFTEDRPPAAGKAWVCFDEIHKFPKWKNTLKAVYDASFEHYQFIVTGSAKFDIFKKSGDSLSGRYFTFRLLPLSLAEVTRSKIQTSPPEDALRFILDKFEPRPETQEALESLLEMSGFPEPFLKQTKSFRAKWAEEYADTVVKEDIGTLTRILDRERLLDLYNLLPEMVGSPLSEASLASHLEISPPTIKNYLKRLEDFYLAFRLQPYSRNIKRALLKAPKGYLFDWTKIQDPAKRFENYIAAELLARLQLWKDASGKKFSLFYVRNKEKEETDFLILKEGAPWMLLEAKTSDGPISGHHFKTQAMLGGIPFVQLSQEKGVHSMQGKNCFRISAACFFS